MNLLHIDFETRSFADLVKLNAWVYSEHKSSDIICMGYKMNNGPVKIWEPGEALPYELNEADYIIAHSALFEHAIISNIGVSKYKFPKDLLDYKKYICTAGMCRSAGLPGGLAKAGAALNIEHQKLDRGKKLIQRYCRPKKNKTTGEHYFIELEGQDKKDMLKYCQVDVMAEHEIYEALKNLPNNKLERKVFTLDFKHNTEGLNIDIKGVDKILEFIGNKNSEIKTDMEKKFPGLLVTSTTQLKKCFRAHGHILPDVQAKTLEALYNKVSPEIQELIDARLFLSKASLKKFQALKNLTSLDDKIRHFLAYYGAGTGRYAGRGFQPHNLPTSQLKESVGYDNLKDLKQADIIENLKKLLPTMIIPKKGYKFLLGDFAAIEARVLAYLAKENKMLKAYYNNEDLYIDMAAKIYHKPKEEITKQNRALGKAAILGAGYGMGVNRFYDMCTEWGMKITEELAKEAIYTYRYAYTKITKFWYDLDSAFKKSVMAPGKNIVGLITIEKVKNYIQVTLPKGRILYYHKIRIKGSNLEYWNHSRGFYVKLWGGIITENIVQAVARDILVDRMLMLEKFNLPTVLHVHDEIICEVQETEAERDLILYNNIMNTVPEWLLGFPLVTESEIADKYYK